MSFRINRHKTGLSIEPCGTPNATHNFFTFQLTYTESVQTEFYYTIIQTTVPRIPQHSILFITRLCLTQSNVRVRSHCSNSLLISHLTFFRIHMNNERNSSANVVYKEFVVPIIGHSYKLWFYFTLTTQFRRKNQRERSSHTKIANWLSTRQRIYNILGINFTNITGDDYNGASSYSFLRFTNPFTPKYSVIVRLQSYLLKKTSSFRCTKTKEVAFHRWEQILAYTPALKKDAQREIYGDASKRRIWSKPR